MTRHEDYVRKLLAGRRITHFYSSEPYGEHMSKALGAVNRQVDLNRKMVPTRRRSSGSLHTYTEIT